MIPVRLLEELRATAQPRLVLLPESGPVDPRAVALLPGSFDPLTIAHAALAEAALERAERVVLVYSVRTLPKEGSSPRPPLLTEAERLAILEAHSSERRGFAVGVSSHGLISEQVEAARLAIPRAELVVAIGSDKLAQLFDPKWYADRDGRLDALFREASVLFAVRAGDEGLVRDVLSRPENARWAGRVARVAIPSEVAGVSSRQVRELVTLGRDASRLVPEAARSALAGLSTPPPHVPPT